MPELTPQDVLVGRLALAQGKVTRPNLDAAIVRVRGGEPGGLAAALVRGGFVSMQDMTAIIAVARTQDASGGRVGASGAHLAPSFPSGPPPQTSPNASWRPATGTATATPFPPGTSPYGSSPPAAAPPPPFGAAPSFGAPPPFGGPPSGGFDPTGSMRARAVPAPVPQGDIPALQSVRMRADPGAGPLPQAGTALHEVVRRQYEEQVLARLLVQRGLVPEHTVREALSRKTQEETASGVHVPLARTLMRAGVVAPGAIEQLGQEIRRKVVSCARCGDCYFVEPGPQPQRFACRRCQGPLDVASLDGRVLPPPTAVQQSPFANSPSPAAAAAATHADASARSTNAAFGTDPGAQPTAGEKIGKWVVERELGRGGMGVVYLANAGSERAAVKVMLNAGQAGEKKLRRFFREIDATKKLQHPNIVQVLDVGEHGGYPFFALEFVDGKPFDKLLKEDLDLEIGMEILEKMCRASHYAHEKGIIHRDLKPANIMVDATMNPKLMDFGLAKNDDHKSVLTRTGAVVGTPYYLSPEQARGESKEIDRRADVYALGVMMYELITGRLPFVGQTTVELYNRILNEDPIPPSKLKPALTKEIEAVCLKALEKDPAKRYQSAELMADDVKALLTGKTDQIKAKPAGKIALGWRKLQRKGLGPVAIGAAIFLVVGTITAIVIMERVRRIRLHDDAVKRELEKIKTSCADLLEQSKKLRAEAESTLEQNRERDALGKAKEAMAAVEKTDGLFTQVQYEENKAAVESLAKSSVEDRKKARALSLVTLARATAEQDDAQALERAHAHLQDVLANVIQDMPEANVALGDLNVLEGNVKAAAEKYDSALQRDPNMLAARIGRARVAMLLEDYRTAIQKLTEARESLGDQPDAAKAAQILVLLARAMLESDIDDSPSKAVEKCDQAIKLQPDHWEAHSVRGLALLALGRRGEGRAELDKGVELAPKLEGPLLARAGARMDERNFDAAKLDAGAAIQLAPTSLDAIVARAEAREALLDDKAGDDADQVVRRRRAPRQWKPAARARRVLARMASIQGDLKAKGLEHAKAALELDPEDSENRLLLARIELDPTMTEAFADQDEKQLKDVKRARFAAEQRRGLAIVLQVKKEKTPSKIERRLQDALKVDGLSPWTNTLLGQHLKGLSSAGSAEALQADKLFDLALDNERDTRREEGWYYGLARRKLAADPKDVEGASAALRRTIFLNPMHAQAMAELSAVLASGNAQRALELAKRATEVNPRSARAWLELATENASVHNNKGDDKPVLEAMKKAEDLLGKPTPATRYVRVVAEHRVLAALVKSNKKTGQPVDDARKQFEDALRQLLAFVPKEGQPIAPDGPFDLNEVAEHVRQEAEAYKVMFAEASPFVREVEDDLKARMTALAKSSEPARELARRSAAELGQGRTDAARELADKAVQTAPWVADGWSALHRARAKSGDKTGALSAAFREAMLDDERAGALVEAVRDARGALTDGEDVARKDEAILALAPTVKPLASVVGRAAILLGGSNDAKAKEDITSAKDGIDAAIRARPDALFPLAVRGLGALATGQNDEGARDLAWVAACRDQNGAARWFVAIANARRNLVDDTIDALEAAADQGDDWRAATDRSLDAARSSPRWAAAEKKAEKASAPKNESPK